MLCRGEFLSVWCLINAKAEVVGLGFFSIQTRKSPFQAQAFGVRTVSLLK